MSEKTAWVSTSRDLVIEPDAEEDGKLDSLEEDEDDIIRAMGRMGDDDLDE